MSQSGRSRLLDAWDYNRPFARFHIRWSDGDLTPAFAQDQAVAIAEQELDLAPQLDLWAQRAVLVTFSSEYVAVGGAPAAGEPAWVVILAGAKRADAPAGAGILSAIAPGGGVVIQCLIHARSGELLLGTALPVHLRPQG